MPNRRVPELWVWTVISTRPLAAVCALGMPLVRSLVTGLALEQLFFSRSPALKDRLRRTWAQSVEGAAQAAQLSEDRLLAVARPVLHALDEDPVGFALRRVAGEQGTRLVQLHVVHDSITSISTRRLRIAS